VGRQVAGALETGFALPPTVWSAAFSSLGGNTGVTGQPVAGDIDGRSQVEASRRGADATSKWQHLGGVWSRGFGCASDSEGPRHPASRLDRSGSGLALRRGLQLVDTVLACGGGVGRLTRAAVERLRSIVQTRQSVVSTRSQSSFASSR
jgi:hypothetical protein